MLCQRGLQRRDDRRGQLGVGIEQQQPRRRRQPRGRVDGGAKAKVVVARLVADARIPGRQRGGLRPVGGVVDDDDGGGGFDAGDRRETAVELVVGAEADNQDRSDGSGSYRERRAGAADDADDADGRRWPSIVPMDEPRPGERGAAAPGCGSGHVHMSEQSTAAAHANVAPSTPVPGRFAAGSPGLVHQCEQQRASVLICVICVSCGGARSGECR